MENMQHELEQFIKGATIDELLQLEIMISGKYTLLPFTIFLRKELKYFYNSNTPK
ncbi:hypothetical protein [Paenibacillus oleatilyticus]|uniref:hypothetical protein n=1 Tax=Paenibacillus oleatilyticus TaxID=2594886 RepID=UPI0035A72E9B